MTWDKKEVSPELVKSIGKTYSCDLLTSSILARRGVTAAGDILFYMEDDLRHQHSPFLFSQMEDAVERILAAKDEGEKVLVSGDRDTDGVTATALLVSALRAMGIDVSWKVPVGGDAYGLSVEIVEEFAAAYGSLVITVDCGISNNKEIKRAAELGIDVIVVDHHNPPAELPDPCIIINPKTDTYPFKDISGCAVAYKLVSALRFSQSDFYRQEICLLNTRPLVDSWCVEAVKIVNGVKKDSLAETIVPGAISFAQTRLAPFLTGQQILVWDSPLQTRALQKIFGPAVEFNLYDIRADIGRVIPQTGDLSLLRVKEISRIAKYQETPPSEIDIFFNLFVTFIQKQIAAKFPQSVQGEAQDIQLVMLAALADIMPMKNENRIFVKQGLKNINEGKARDGIPELMSAMNLLKPRVTSVDISWNIVPAINGAGRMGKADLAVEFFLEENVKRRGELAKQLAVCRAEAKRLRDDAWEFVRERAFKSVEEHGGNLCVVLDERVHRGVSGLLASRLVQATKVPAIVVTRADSEGEAETFVGSIRTARGVDATATLSGMADLFINYGGHKSAGGFSLKKSAAEEFLARLKSLSDTIALEDAEERIIIDAEIPFDYMTPELLNVVDSFEPFGECNPELRFVVRNAKIVSADLIGKVEKSHLRLTMQCGKYKWPAVYWNSAERYGNSFALNDTVDVVFSVSHNYYNGNENPRMNIIDIKRSSDLATNRVV
jgi:single-stranded-DNA-specific exonuclease